MFGEAFGALAGLPRRFAARNDDYGFATPPRHPERSNPGIVMTQRGFCWIAAPLRGSQ
jgi:hypothetical protein